MDKHQKVAALFGEAKRNASEVMEKARDFAVRVADQNDDGKLDAADVAVVVNEMGAAVKKRADAVKANAEEQARNMELKKLRPIFPETLDNTDFYVSKLIRITERDKKRTESEVCKGAIGYISEQKGQRIVNIYRDAVASFGIIALPDADGNFYYIDPSDRDSYIAIDEYFGYLKKARINELQMIAQDLGAKHFRVTYKEEKSSFLKKEGKVKAKLGVAAADGEHEDQEKSYSKIEVAAENYFVGHDPMEPTLKYLQRDEDVQLLIAMCSKPNRGIHRKCLIQLSNSSGIKASEAVKIDAVLKGMKGFGNISFEAEAKNESKRYLEYEIDF